MLLCERVQLIEEGITPGDVREICVLLGIVGIANLVRVWLNRTPSKSKVAAMDKLERNSRVKDVLTSVAAIKKKNVQPKFISSFSLYEYVTAGISSSEDLKKYMNKYKSEIDKASAEAIVDIDEYNGDTASATKLKSMSAKLIVDFRSGNLVFMAGGKCYEWDNRKSNLKEIASYEDLIIDNIYGIYDTFKEKGLLVSSND